MRSSGRCGAWLLVGLIGGGGPWAQAQEAPLQMDAPELIVALRAVERTNRERARHGLAPLKAQEQLMAAARAHAEEMAREGYFSHTDRRGRGPQERARARGYHGCRAENITIADDEEGAVSAWVGGEGHRRHLLSRDYTEIGVGWAQDGEEDGNRYWVQMFGAREGYPVIINHEAPETDDPRVRLWVWGAGRARWARYSNDGVHYTEWEPFRSEREWTLEPGEGVRSVVVELSDGAGGCHMAWDTILLRSPQRAAASDRPPSPPSPSQGRPAVPAPGAAPGGADAVRVVPPASGKQQRPSPVESIEPVVVPMVFPVLGKVSWTDTFGAPRDGGRRQHQGQDLTAPKMRPVVAAFDGVVHLRRAGAGGHNMLFLDGDNGWRAAYMHLNNDTPGTDDGLGSEHHAFAPGLNSGDRVLAGQFLGWVGDSGNAEGTGSHLHFELWGDRGCVNPAPSLRAALRLDAPRLNLPARSIRPGGGEIRLDGVVRSVDREGGVLSLSLIARWRPDGDPAAWTLPDPGWVEIGAAVVEALGEGRALPLDELAEGDQVIVLARDRGRASRPLARRVLVRPNR